MIDITFTSAVVYGIDYRGNNQTTMERGTHPTEQEHQTLCDMDIFLLLLGDDGKLHTYL